MLGPNAFAGFRLEIDYPNSAVYLERTVKESGEGAHDMDIVPLTLRPEADGSITVIGVPDRDGVPFVKDIEPGDKLMKIDGMETKGRTFGTVVDALRGKPGDKRDLEIERKGKKIKVTAKVERTI